MGTAVIIQARMGSSRLPGKVLMPLLGKPMFGRIVDQLRQVLDVDEVVLTTTEDSIDDQLVRYAGSIAVKVSRGPVDDIVTRLYRASREVASGSFIRIWGDCPFVCPDVLSTMLSQFNSESLDFLTTSDPNARGVPAGLDAEIYATPLIERMNREVKDIKKREFPFEFVKTDSATRIGRFRLQEMDPKLSLTVDYPEDLVAAEEIYRSLIKLPFSYPDLLAVFQRRPELKNMFSEKQRNVEYFNYIKNQKGANGGS